MVKIALEGQATLGRYSGFVYTTIRFNKKTTEIVGADGINYGPFKLGAIERIPEANAKALIASGVAEEVVEEQAPKGIEFQSYKTLSHKLIIGSSEDVPELKRGSVHCAFTSPPYFEMRGDVPWKSYQEFLDTMERCFKETYRILKPTRVFGVNISDYIYRSKSYPIPFHFFSLLEKVGFKYVDTILWIKPHGMSSTASQRAGLFIQYPYPLYYNCDRITEFILVMSKGGKKLDKIKPPTFEESKLSYSNFKDFLSNCWYITPDSDEGHSSIFPLKLPMTFIQFYSYKGEVIYDPFLGSGTTMLAAKRSRRSSVGVEKEPKYIPLIKDKVGWGDQDILGGVSFELIERDKNGTSIG